MMKRLDARIRFYVIGILSSKTSATLLNAHNYGGQTLTIKCADLEYIYKIKHIDNNYLNDNGGNDGFCSKPTGYVLIDSKLFFFEICKPFIAKYLFCFTILN